jgi:hypothetical protein
MLWIILKNDSHSIIACNVCQRDGKYELWVTRPTGKSLKLMESKEEKDISTIKEAIDYAVEHGETALRL